jgi:hypothetical protein
MIANIVSLLLLRIHQMFEHISIIYFEVIDYYYTRFQSLNDQMMCER